MEKIHIEDESGDKKYFTIIPNYILNHSTMWDREVYIQMKRIAGERGTCWTSRNTLAKQCGMSPRRLDKALKYLVEHKWITFIGKKEVGTRGGAQEVNEYKIIDLWDLNNQFYQEKGLAGNAIPKHKGIAPGAQRGSTDEAKGIAPGATKEEPLKEEPKEEDTAQSAGDATNREYTADFLSFWEEYPRKTGKGAAWTSWKRSRLPSLPAIIASLGKQKTSAQWKKENGQFIPFPATWLNQRRWEDESEIETVKSSKYQKYA